MKKYSSILLVALVSVLLVACSPNKKTETSQGLKVVTTFYPMYDFTKKIVGDQGEVTMLITGETEPHDYEPSAKDIAAIQDADVFIYNSKEMETWVAAVLASIDTKKVEIIEASQGIELLTGEESDEGHDQDHDHAHGVDPHVWLDPVLAQQEVSTIAKGLSQVAPNDQAYFETTSQRLIAELKTLDEAFSKAFKEAKNRDMVTQHAAFGYLAARYNLHQVAISGISPDQEPSPNELAKIQDFVKKEKVEIIYTEELASDKIAKTIAEATGVKLVTLNTLEGLSNKQQAAGEDYLSVMEDNLKALSQSIK